MPTRAFDDVVQRLATHVPGCPFPVIEKYVRDAAIEVCEKALVWKYEQPPIRPNHDPEALGRPRNIVHYDADHFALAPVPDDEEDYDLVMLVALKPLRTARGMDQTVLDEIENTVMDGALACLYMLPDKNWTSVQAANYHKQQFIARTSERRARANLGAGRASLSVRMRPFARRRGSYGRRY
jgi:hypothetical protein